MTYIDYVDPSLAKYINQEEIFKKIIGEPKAILNNFGEIYPKKLNFNEKRHEESKENNKQINLIQNVNKEGFDSFAKTKEIKNNPNNHPDLHKLTNDTKGDIIENKHSLKRKTSI